METKSETFHGKTPDGRDAMAETGTIIHEGREYTSGGAYIDGQVAIGYLKKTETGFLVTMWNGETMGEARIVAMWDTPRSCYSRHCFQVEALINGVFYTGRGAGAGMVWKGKRMAKPGFSRPSFRVRMLPHEKLG